MAIKSIENSYAMIALEQALVGQQQALSLWEFDKLAALEQVERANEKLVEISDKIDELEATLKDLRDRATQQGALQRAIDSRG